jgi:hypothetical protein
VTDSTTPQYEAWEHVRALTTAWLRTADQRDEYDGYPLEIDELVLRLRRDPVLLGMVLDDLVRLAGSDTQKLWAMHNAIIPPDQWIDSPVDVLNETIDQIINNPANLDHPPES